MFPFMRRIFISWATNWNAGVCGVYLRRCFPVLKKFPEIPDSYLAVQPFVYKLPSLLNRQQCYPGEKASDYVQDNG